MFRPDASSYTYDALALLQRVCTYIYDTVVIPYIANTYATATTITVITGAYQRATTTTTTTVHRSRHNSKSGKNQALATPRSARSAACHATVPTYTYCYDCPTLSSNDPTTPTPTTTDSTTVIYTEIPAIATSLPADTPPTTNADVYYYGYRYYCPELGRWVSRDPIGDEAFLSFYLAGKPLAERKALRGAALYPPYLFCVNNSAGLYDILGLDCPGCDLVPNWGWVETPCVFRACAYHDACYDRNSCSAFSWIGTILKEECRDTLPDWMCPAYTPCDHCNLNVRDHILHCITGGNPGTTPLFYCAKQHRFITIGPGANFGTRKQAEKCCCD